LRSLVIEERNVAVGRPGGDAQCGLAPEIEGVQRRYGSAQYVRRQKRSFVDRIRIATQGQLTGVCKRERSRPGDTSCTDHAL
jgi:hypothetical protein